MTASQKEQIDGAAVAKMPLGRIIYSFKRVQAEEKEYFARPLKQLLYIRPAVA